MTNISPKFGMNLLSEGQAGHAAANAALSVAESIAQLVVLDRDLTVPPGGESEGDTYLVGASATGAWLGQDGKIAIYYGGGWYSDEAGDFPAPYEGLVAYVVDEDLLMVYNGTAWVPLHGNVIGPHNQRMLMSPLPSGTSGITLTADRAYFVYVGQTLRRQTWQYVSFVLTGVASGAQTAEVGLFSTPLPPNKAGQSLTKLVATGSVDSLTAGAGTVKKNSSAFATQVSRGVHLWAGIRTNMATTQPGILAVQLDMNQGFVLQTNSAGALTGSGPWTGALMGVGTTVQCPALRVELD